MGIYCFTTTTGSWWKSGSRADSNIMAKKQKMIEGHMVGSARWQQGHVSATCPGEYVHVLLLLLSQCGMTPTPCLHGWLAVCQAVLLSISSFVGLQGDHSATLLIHQPVCYPLIPPAFHCHYPHATLPWTSLEPCRHTPGGFGYAKMKPVISIMVMTRFQTHSQKDK